MELPLGASFRPQVAALTSPSLFYVMNPRAGELMCCFNTFPNLILMILLARK